MIPISAEFCICILLINPYETFLMAYVVQQSKLVCIEIKTHLLCSKCFYQSLNITGMRYDLAALLAENCYGLAVTARSLLVFYIVQIGRRLRD